MEMRNTTMLRHILISISAATALAVSLAGQTARAGGTAAEIARPQARATGSQHRQYTFAPTGQQMPYRVFVPPTWDGKAHLPIILMLHGAGADENTYMS